MRAPTRSLALAIVLVAWPWAAPFAQNVEEGEVKAKIMCDACHGPKGSQKRREEMPILAGQNATYLVNQLKAYRDGSRPDPVMQSLAKSLSDADIENLAAYYARQRGVLCW